jgi:hypothetical protein
VGKEAIIKIAHFTLPFPFFFLTFVFFRRQLAKSKTLQGKESRSDVSNTPPPLHHASNLLAPSRFTQFFSQSTLSTGAIETPRLDFEYFLTKVFDKIGLHSK